MKQRLGEMLISADQISEEQLEKALTIQKEEGNLLGFILVNLGFIDETTLLDYLEQQGTKVKVKEKKMRRKKYYS